VGDTYEAIRRRSFRELIVRMRLVRNIVRFGINIVVNERTLSDHRSSPDPQLRSETTIDFVGTNLDILPACW
jgi:hypothetical protein